MVHAYLNDINKIIIGPSQSLRPRHAISGFYLLRGNWRFILLEVAVDKQP